MNDTHLLFIGLSTVAILLTYILTKRSLSKKIDQYTSLDEALIKVEENISIADKNYKDIQLSVKTAEDKLESINIQTKDLQILQGQDNSLKFSIQKAQTDIKNSESKLENLNESIEKYLIDLDELMGSIDLYSRIHEYTTHGHFETPEYLYDTSVRYASEIKDVRLRQKEMIKNKTAITCPEKTIFSGDKNLIKKVIDGQVRLMLSSFNIECDLIIGKVSPSSFDRTLERIEKLANNLEKSAATLECGFNIDYIELKFQECKLQYQFTLRKAEEIAEQKLIREQIREEQRAIKEYEKAIADAEKEEKMYRNLLDKAQAELAKSTEKDRTEMEQKIAILEQQLADAEDREKRAKSMAEQTRRGHVYVISNIGSFGENIYKIGLTRRLEPMDRVKELGDASVPFPFDVHAMIYVDDAPALETALHREFTTRRVNAVNLRKEFFNVDLHEIKAAVNKIVGLDADFKLTASASDYYESLRLISAPNNTSRKLTNNVMVPQNA